MFVSEVLEHFKIVPLHGIVLQRMKSKFGWIINQSTSFGPSRAPNRSQG
jgi:hypothetical protein